MRAAPPRHSVNLTLRQDERLAADELAAHCRRSGAFALGELEQAA
jgi:hypothetical protein